MSLRAIFVCDVASFGQRAHSYAAQKRIRDGLYTALRRSFEHARISMAEIYHEDRGDGVMMLVPLEFDPALLVTEVAGRLRVELLGHNREVAAIARIQLRVAVHIGYAHDDGNGIVGGDVTHAFRLLDAEGFKTACRAGGGPLGLIVSERFHHEIILRHIGDVSPGDYRPIEINAKETVAIGWLRTFGEDLALPAASVDRGQAHPRR